MFKKITNVIVGIKNKLYKRMNRLPIVFTKVKNIKKRVFFIFDQNKIYLKNLVKMQFHPVIFQDNVLSVFHNLYIKSFQIGMFYYTVECINFRYEQPYIAETVKLAHRLIAILNNIDKKNVKELLNNVLISCFTAYSLVNSTTIEMNVRSELFRSYDQNPNNLFEYILRSSTQFPREGNVNPKFEGPTITHGRFLEYLKVNFFDLRKKPELIISTFFSLKNERQNILNMKNLSLKKEEIKILKILSLKRQRSALKKQPKRLSEPVTTMVLFNFQKIEKNILPYYDSNDQRSIRNIKKWTEENKINQKQNLISKKANEIIKYEKNGKNEIIKYEKNGKNEIIKYEKNGKGSLENPIECCVVRPSELSNFIRRERKIIKMLAIRDYELSAGVLLDKIAYNKMMHEQQNLPIHQHRLKILRKIQKKVSVRQSFSMTRFIRRIFLY